ncbi:CVNH domain-containing protein [Apiospora rasikravindrae]|uniref:CVNH domain-containing protein n=1 Tax=Apiospora rasikravindrae TaxID=990691 RepID=A0ABR1TEX2_9PEZI
MKVAAVILALVGASRATSWGANCYDEKLDATGLLTANCDAGDGQGTLKPNSIDLNKCFGWDGQQIADIPNGNYSDSCTDCTLNRLIYRLPIYRRQVWLNCTCGEPPVDAALNTGKRLIRYCLT